MGTIEHFDESDAAVREMWRVLKPGGRAVVGVPNRLDPFLRPLLVAAMSADSGCTATDSRSRTRDARFAR